MAPDLSKSGYPTYRDGIKTKQMFAERLLKAFERNDEQMLLFVNDGTAQGLIHYYWIPEDAFCTREATEQLLSEFLSFISERFGGYDAYLGFPAENQKAVDYLSGRGFECIEDDYNNTAVIEGLQRVTETGGIVRIEKENYGIFRVLHSQAEGVMYWNSDRLFEDLGNWIILAKEKDGKAQGAVYYQKADDGWYEIFGIDIDQGKYDPVPFAHRQIGCVVCCKAPVPLYSPCCFFSAIPAGGRQRQ